MARVKLNEDRLNQGSIHFVLILLLAAFYPVLLYAQTSSVTISNPLPSANVNSEFKMRDGVAHTGLDLRAQKPTEVPHSGQISFCGLRNGYGLQAQIQKGCGVVEAFSHLTSCSGDKIVTGNSDNKTGAPSKIPFHLHYEISINGTYVNPEKAFGKNLCDEAVRKELIDDANKTLNGKAGGGGAASAGSSSAAPAVTTPPNTVTSVETGQPDPTTGIVNTGPTYYITETPDGRTYREYEPGSSPSTMTILPPTISTAVPTGGVGGGDVTSCGTDTWNAMMNQAVLQTRREVDMNARFIAKPDSVMTYSCFNDMLNIAGQTIGPIFSESKRWANTSIDILDKAVPVNRDMGEYSLDGAITNASYHPYKDYITAYFNHDLLGGLAGSAAGAAPAGGGGDDGDGDEAPSPQASVACGTMASVWNMAKGLNPLTDTPAFPKFSELIGNDPRKYPSNYTSNDSGISQDMIDVAQNKSAQFSKVKPYFELLLPQGTNCAPPIFTGVTVVKQYGDAQTSTQITYPDGLCVTAGCSYLKGGSGSSDGICAIQTP